MHRPCIAYSSFATFSPCRFIPLYPLNEERIAVDDVEDESHARDDELQYEQTGVDQQKLAEGLYTAE